MRQERTTKAGKGLRRMKFYAHGPSRPMRWDFMDVPLLRHMANFAMRSHSKNVRKKGEYR